VSDFPNINRLAQADPDKLTSRQHQILVFHSAPETFAQSTAEQSMLAHIDELYGDINALKVKCELMAEEIAVARTESVEAFVERRLDHRDGEAAQAQVDDWRIAARIAWNQKHPVLADFLKTRGAR